jgi:hypothetical protein
MQVAQTADVPPSTGKVIFANIGSIRNSKAALRNSVRENRRTGVELRLETSIDCRAGMSSDASGGSHHLDGRSSRCIIIQTLLTAKLTVGMIL